MNQHSNLTGHPGRPPRSVGGWTMPVITVIGVALAIVTAFIGSGALGGTPIAEAAGGALSADATPVAPAGAAFSIWSVIYLGLAAYAVWQLFPVARRSPRQRALRPWALISVLLNAAWIWTVQWGVLIVSVVVIVALLAVLIRILFLLGRPREGGWVELLLTDGVFGWYFGWVLVACFANTYAWLSDAGVTAFREIPVGLAGVIVAGVVAVVAAALDGGRIAPALATGWGLAWIAVGRSSGSFESPVLTWSAVIAAVIVVLAAVLLRLRSRTRAETGAGGPKPTPTTPGSTTARR